MPKNNNIDLELLEQIYNCSTFCVFDDNLSITQVNQNFKALIGYTDDLVGKNLLQIKHGEQSNNIYEFLIKTLKNGDIWKGELQFQHKEKQIIWLDASIKPITSNTNSNRYLATFIDISHRKLLIDNLKKRAHRQGLIAILGQISLNNIPIYDLLEQSLSVICGSLNIKTGLILELSINGEHALVRAAYNPINLQAGKDILEIKKNNILQKTLQQDRPVICESLHNEHRYNIPIEFIHEKTESAFCLTIGDKKYPFGILTLLSESPINLNIDETHFLQSIANILAEAINRQNMEQALRHERALSRNYLDVAEVVFIVLDTKENILLANRYSALVLGCPQNDLLGMNFIENFIPDAEKYSVRSSFNKVLSHESVSDDLINTHGNVTSIINKHNDTRYIRWKISPLFDEDKNINAIIAAGEDITGILEFEKEQKTLEEQLHQAQKVEAIGMLAGGIAHDFNNILASILGFSELSLEAIDESDEKLKNYLTQIHSSGIKARDIIAQMQSINLQDETPNTAILLPSLLKGTLQMLRSALPASIDIQHNIYNDVPAVTINASKFNQIVMHLLTNSRNALQGKGNIKLKLSLENIQDTPCSSCNSTIIDKYVVFSIDDDGPGIDQNTLLTIFSDKKRNSKSGLALINTIMHEAAGHLIISDSQIMENKNMPGTCIKLLFKISEEKTKDKESSETAINHDEILSKHLMIIDDENSVATYMSELFKGAGFKVSTYCDPVEALQAFKNNDEAFDLIISDQTMPVITGDILARQILEIKPDLPIIICTGHSDLLDEEKAKNLHIKALMKKPINSAELLRTVMELLAKNNS